MSLLCSCLCYYFLLSNHYKRFQAINISRIIFTSQTTTFVSSRRMSDDSNINSKERPQSVDVSCDIANSSSAIPLICLPNQTSSSSSAFSSTQQQGDLQNVSKQVVDALKTSGFLLIKSPHMPLDLQQQAIKATTSLFVNEEDCKKNNLSDNDYNNLVIYHPTDPKRYVMLFSKNDLKTIPIVSSSSSSSLDVRSILSTYWDALEETKGILLKCIAIGLELDDPDYFNKLHQQNNSALRLLYYPCEEEEKDGDSSVVASTNEASTKSTVQQQQNSNTITTTENSVTIRCKAHSDYGSLTLLLTDSVPGLQAFVQNQWINVPYVEGAIVVNIGSLLSDWTNHALLATLHRVIVATNTGTRTNHPRTSLAFFTDPDKDVSARLKITTSTKRQKTATATPTTEEEEEEEGDTADTSTNSMSVAEYIQWRSGGNSNERSGLAFTEKEQDRLNNKKQ